MLRRVFPRARRGAPARGADRGRHVLRRPRAAWCDAPALAARMLACSATTLIGFCVLAPLVLMRTVQRRTHSQARAVILTSLVGRAGERIALEVDGPHHFAANTLAPGGGMLARHRLLAARGWAVVSVPYYAWDQLNNAGRGAWLMQARPHCSMLASSLRCSCRRKMRAMRVNDRHVKLQALQKCWEVSKDARASLQAIHRAREAHAVAAALPPGAPRPVPTFTDLAAKLAPLRMFEDVVCAERKLRAAGVVGLRGRG